MSSWASNLFRVTLLHISTHTRDFSRKEQNKLPNIPYVCNKRSFKLALFAKAAIGVGGIVKEGENNTRKYLAVGHEINVQAKESCPSREITQVYWCARVWVRIYLCEYARKVSFARFSIHKWRLCTCVGMF